MKYVFRPAVVAAATVFSQLSPAVAATCDQLNSLYQTKFHSDFKVTWAQAAFQCPSNQSAIVEAMNDLYTTTFRMQPAPDMTDFYSWVVNSISGMAYSDQEPGVPWSVATTQSGVITLHKTFGAQDPVWRTSVLVHETRHTQSDDPGHVACDHGPNKGNAACDAALVADTSWGGSGYNYQFRYLWWVRDQSSYTPLDKTLVETTIKSLVLNNFNSVTNTQVRKWAN